MPVAAVAAWAAVFGASWPPTLERPAVEYAAASTQVLIDSGRFSPLVDLSGEVDGLSTRALLYTRLVVTDPVKASIAREAGLRPAEIIVSSRTSGSGITRSAREAASEQRAEQLAGEYGAKRLLFAAEDGLPVISIVAQAPTAELAINLADAGARGLEAYVKRIEKRQQTPVWRRVEVRQLGPAQGGVVNSGAGRSLALLAFFAVFAVWCGAVLFGSSLVAALRQSAASACARCGREVPQDGSFCPGCGAPADATPATQAEVVFAAAGDGAVAAGARRAG